MKDITFENVTTEQATKLSELYAALKGDGIGELSDGYHTFNELYHHRAILCNLQYISGTGMEKQAAP